MEIIKDINSKRLERKLDDGLTEVKEFFDNGQLEYHYFEDENSEKHGECKWYYENGPLLEHRFYKNGKRHGECKSYRSNGQLWEHKLYENGELVKDYL